MEKIKSENNIKNIDMILSVYISCLQRENIFGETMTTMRDIESLTYNNHHSDNIKAIREALRLLQDYGYLSFDFDIGTVKPTDCLIMSAAKPDKWMKVYKHDIELMKKLGSSFFLLYAAMENFVNRDKGYSFVSYERLESLMSSATISKYINIAYALGIYDVTCAGDGWVYKEEYGKAIRSNNMYIRDTERCIELASMSKEEINDLTSQSIEGVSEDRYKARIYKYLSQRNIDCSDNAYSRTMSDLSIAGREFVENYIVKNKALTEADVEFEKAIKLYAADKYIRKDKIETAETLVELDKEQEEVHNEMVNADISESVSMSELDDIHIYIMRETGCEGLKPYKKQNAKIDNWIVDHGEDVVRFAFDEAIKYLSRNGMQYQSLIHRFNTHLSNVEKQFLAEAINWKVKMERQEDNILALMDSINETEYIGEDEWNRRRRLWKEKHKEKEKDVSQSDWAKGLW